MAVITIDGKKLEVPDNKNVLECALDAGIYIPHLCHHKDLNPLGSCRMCIVEVNGQDGVMASCTLEGKRWNGHNDKKSKTGSAQETGIGTFTGRTSGRLLDMSEIWKL